MKHLKTTIVLLLVRVMSFAQVGIGTNTPESSSVLELKAADKALLLTRVANTAAVTTPVNGMMVYDISSNCIKGYQNGAWTACLSACGASNNISNGGDWGFDFTFTMKQIASTFDEVSAYSSGCVTTDGKVFLWGRNWSTTFFNTSNILTTPVYSPLPNGELAEKILMSAYVAMVLTETGKIYVMGNDNYASFGGFSLPRLWSQVTIPGETSFVDFVYTGNLQTFLQSSSGKVYRCGRGVSNAAPETVTTFTQMLFPVGVTSYTAIWSGDTSSRCVFLKGNNNNIYAAGDNAYGQLGIGTSTASVTFNAAPVKVLFPTGVNIVKISASRFRCLTLTDTGVAYGWGYWKSGTSPNVVYYFAASPAPADISGNNILKPSPITLPTLNSDIKFTDVWAADKYTVVRTDKMVYFKGYNFSGIVMRPITSDDVAYGNSSPPSEMDMVNGTNYNFEAPVWNKFKTIITGGTGGSSSSQFVFAISQNDRGFVWGESRYASGGIGGGDNYIFLPRPTPIATGIGDPINPNPLY